MRSVKAAQAEAKLPHAQLGQLLCILTGDLTLLGNGCQSTIIQKKQMGEVKIYLLISLTHGQAVRKTQRNEKNWCLPREADQVPFPKLSIPPIWHQRSRTSLFDPQASGITHLSSLSALLICHRCLVPYICVSHSFFHATPQSLWLFFNFSPSRGIYSNLLQELDIQKAPLLLKSHRKKIV